MILIQKTIIENNENSLHMILGVFENEERAILELEKHGNQNLQKIEGEYVIKNEDSIEAVFDFIPIDINVLTEIY